MGRPKKYSSAAEKQHAYRERQRTSSHPPPPLSARPRLRSRPERLRVIEGELRDLAAGYQHWREALPDNQSGTELADRLEAVVEKLETMADEVGDLDPPRGFGR